MTSAIAVLGGRKPSEQQKDVADALNIYPDYCHESSPTILKWCPMRVADVHDLKDIGMFVDDMRLHHYNNHPVKWVKVIAIVVAVDEWKKENGSRRVYTIDDGSGMTIECGCLIANNTPTDIKLEESKTKFSTISVKDKIRNAKVEKGTQQPEGVNNPNVPWDLVDVGTIVKLKGRVGTFRDSKQVDVVRIEVVRGLDVEVKFWDESRDFKRDVLDKHWVLTNEEVEKLKRRRDKLLRKERHSKGKDKEKTAIGKESIKDMEKRKRKHELSEADTARRMLEEETRKNTLENEYKRKRKDDESKRQQEKVHKKKSTNSDGMNGKSRINYPSLAARRAAAGKYDALGI